MAEPPKIIPEENGANPSGGGVTLLEPDTMAPEPSSAISMQEAKENAHNTHTAADGIKSIKSGQGAAHSTAPHADAPHIQADVPHAPSAPHMDVPHGGGGLNIEEGAEILLEWTGPFIPGAFEAYQDGRNAFLQGETATDITIATVSGFGKGTIDYNNIHDAFYQSDNSFDKSASKLAQATAQDIGTFALTTAFVVKHIAPNLLKKAAQTAETLEAAAIPAFCIAYTLNALQEGSEFNESKRENQIKLNEITTSSRHEHLAKYIAEHAGEWDKNLKEHHEKGLKRLPNNQIDLSDQRNHAIFKVMLGAELKHIAGRLEETDLVVSLPGESFAIPFFGSYLKDKSYEHLDARIEEKQISAALSELNSIELHQSLGISNQKTPQQYTADYQKLVAAGVRPTGHVYEMRDGKYTDNYILNGRPAVPDYVTKEYLKNPNTNTQLTQVTYKTDAHGKSVPDGIVVYTIRDYSQRQSFPLEPILIQPPDSIKTPQPKPVHIAGIKINVSAKVNSEIELTSIPLTSMLEPIKLEVPVLTTFRLRGTPEGNKPNGISAEFLPGDKPPGQPGKMQSSRIAEQQPVPPVLTHTADLAPMTPQNSFANRSTGVNLC